MSTASRAEPPVILVTGCTGQLGWELCRTLMPLGNIVQVGHPDGPATGHPLDLADPDALRALLDELRPDLIINAAAYTAVDQAESDEATAMAVNARAPALLAEHARRTGALLVHYSTDYVFDGEGTRPYREDDPATPINVYGRSKLAGEQAIREVDPHYFVFRTSWLYGARGQNFLLTMLRLAAERPTLRIVDDQIGSPTWARAVAEATAQVLAQARALGDDWRRERRGVYHLAAAGECSWHGFARAILDARTGVTRPVNLVAIPSADYPVAARRPAYSVLDCGAARRAFGLDLGPWERHLARVMEELRPFK